MTSAIQLGESLAQAAIAVRPYPPGTTPQDSLRLQLPPIDAGRDGLIPSARVLRVIAALYLYAEHEQAGLIPVVEVLAASRDTLPIRSDVTAGKLEAFYQRERQWYDRSQRNALFARLFGLGPGSDQGGNHDFQRIFATFCLAVVTAAQSAQFGQPGTFESARVSETALELLANLGAHQYGNTLTAAPMIHDQLAAAVDLLLDNGLQTAFETQGMWNLLQKIMGDQAPDFGRLSHRGQSGQRILDWLANALPQLAGSPPRTPLIGAQAPVAVWASGWLEATGILPSSSRQVPIA